MVRRVLGVLVVLLIGAAAGYGLAAGDIMAPVDGASELVDGAISGPATENVTKRIQGQGHSSIQSVVLFESGAANITFDPDHSPNYKLAFGHAQNDICKQNYQTWDTPEFSGPLTVDLQSVVESNGPYPNSQFELSLIAEANGVCSKGIGGATFTAPPSWTK